jgi:hypothetical protein
MDPAVISLIESNNQLDIEPYNYARQLLEKRISAQNTAFRRELQLFRFFNNGYGNSRQFAGRILNQVRA